MSQITPGAAGAGSTDAGRAVAAGQGWVWIMGGFELFKKQPAIWVGLILILVVILFALGLLNILFFLGAIATFVLLPVFAGGLMLGCQALTRGSALEIGHLFAGFKAHTGNLVVLGGLTILGVIVVILPAVLIVGAGNIIGQISSPGAGVAAISSSLVIAWLISMGIAVPISMALWFAPALVALRGIPPVAAVQQSFFGCLKNIVPFLIYGIVCFVLIAILLGVTFVFGLVLGPFAVIVYVLGWLVLGPTLVGSVYSAYRDIYGDS